MGNIIGGRLIASIIPVLCGIVGVFVSNLPFSFLGGWFPAPLYALMPIYFWCLVRPDLMSPGWAFVIGVLHDMLSGGPPGIWAASFVATYALVDKQRDAFAGLSGWGALLGFATASLMCCACGYLFYVFYRWQWLPISPYMKEFAATVLLYAPVAVGLGAVHRKLVGPLRSDF
ncbi:MAG: rod shape-determining protein MreD [Alphaproteobacteria bacterium]|nr:rod shape-determining protein MreD [Alphaproteobacteria bacterium]